MTLKIEELEVYQEIVEESIKQIKSYIISNKNNCNEDKIKNEIESIRTNCLEFLEDRIEDKNKRETEVSNFLKEYVEPIIESKKQEVAKALSAPLADINSVQELLEKVSDEKALQERPEPIIRDQKEALSRIRKNSKEYQIDEKLSRREGDVEVLFWKHPDSKAFDDKGIIYRVKDGQILSVEYGKDAKAAVILDPKENEKIGASVIKIENGGHTLHGDARNKTDVKQGAVEKALNSVVATPVKAPAKGLAISAASAA